METGAWGLEIGEESVGAVELHAASAKRSMANRAP